MVSLSANVEEAFKKDGDDCLMIDIEQLPQQFLHRHEQIDILAAGDTDMSRPTFLLCRSACFSGFMHLMGPSPNYHTPYFPFSEASAIPSSTPDKARLTGRQSTAPHVFAMNSLYTPARLSHQFILLYTAALSRFTFSTLSILAHFPSLCCKKPETTPSLNSSPTI